MKKTDLLHDLKSGMQHFLLSKAASKRIIKIMEAEYPSQNLEQTRKIVYSKADKDFQLGIDIKVTNDYKDDYSFFYSFYLFAYSDVLTEHPKNSNSHKTYLFAWGEYDYVEAKDLNLSFRDIEKPILLPSSAEFIYNLNNFNDILEDLNKDPKKDLIEGLKTVILPHKVKEEVMAAMAQISNYDKLYGTWGFSDVLEKGTGVNILLWGKPGTGKTLLAQMVAKALKKELKIIQSAEIQSSTPGEPERRLKAFFAEAEKLKQILLFDECDSLITPRHEVGMVIGAEINALLTALENYRGISFFTTNRLGKMDEAFARRLSATIEVPMPTYEARVQIFERLIPAKAPVSANLALYAKPEISGGNIKNIVLNAARRAIYLEKEFIDDECFEIALESELNAIRAFREESKKTPKVGNQVNKVPNN